MSCSLGNFHKVVWEFLNDPCQNEIWQGWLQHGDFFENVSFFILAS